MPFDVQQTEIEGALEIVPKIFADERGRFAELFKASDLQEVGVSGSVVQTNHSWSVQGTIRGLHYQAPPKAQAKLVVVLEGEVMDVAVDIRQGSPTFGQAVQRVLDAERKHMLYIPEGFAHGFGVLSAPGAQVMYYVFGAEYAPEAEAGIAWDDPGLAIDWQVVDPVLSEKDMHFPGLQEADIVFQYDT